MAADPIEHVIVLMLENRSFDHVLGALPHVDGVDPAHPKSNREAPGSSIIHVQRPNAVRKMKPDPAHAHDDVMRQLQVDLQGQPGVPAGFVHDFCVAHPRSSAQARTQVMAYFPLAIRGLPDDLQNSALPGIHELARSFCVCDAWYSSVPGPTWPNRFFVHSGTSQGWITMPDPPLHWNLHKYDQPTIYDRLNESPQEPTWRIYFGDVPQSLLLYNQRKAHNRKHYHSMSAFYRDVASADPFPSYVFIEPDYLPFGQNDMHPPADVAKTDALVSSVYNAIRANDRLWRSTLLIVTWDEHGGFYDHVMPPAAPAPDSKNQEGFDFRLYGLRVPAILVSPWVEPGGVFNTHTNAPHTNRTDHTSILRYLTDKFTLRPLTNRVSEADSLALAIQPHTSASSPLRVGDEAPDAERPEVMDLLEPELNLNQRLLIDFTRQLELEMGASPRDVGLRAVRAASSIQGEIEVAKERVQRFLAQ